MRLLLPSATIAVICSLQLASLPHSTRAFSVFKNQSNLRPRSISSSSSSSSTAVHQSSTTDFDQSYFFKSSTTEHETFNNPIVSEGVGNHMDYLNSLTSQATDHVQHTTTSPSTDSAVGQTSYLDNLAFASSIQSSSQELADFEKQVEQEINLHKSTIEAGAANSIEQSQSNVEASAVNLAEGSKTLGEVSGSSNKDEGRSTSVSATNDYFNNLNAPSTTSVSYDAPTTATVDTAPSGMKTSTQSLFNLSSSQLVSIERQVESEVNYKAEEMTAEASVIKDVEVSVEKLVSAAVGLGKNVFDLVSQQSNGSSNNYFEQSSTVNEPIVYEVTQPNTSIGASTSAPSDAVLQPAPQLELSHEQKVETDITRYRQDEIAAEARVEREVEISAQKMVELSATLLAEGKKTIDELSVNDSSSRLFVSSTTESYEEPQKIETAPLSQLSVAKPLSEIDLRAIELSVEQKVVKDIERAAERMVEDGAAALAEGKTFETTSMFAGSTKSTYFYKPSTSHDAVVNTAGSGTTSSYFSKPTTSYDEPVVSTALPVEVPTTTYAEPVASAVLPTEVFKPKLNAQRIASIESMIETDVEKKEESAMEAKAVKEAETSIEINTNNMSANQAGASKTVPASAKTATTKQQSRVEPVQYNVFTPLPEVQSKQGSYLDALVGTGSASISGSGQSSYLEAIQSQNVKTLSGTGTGQSTYLQSVSSNKPLSLTKVESVITTVQPDVKTSETPEEESTQNKPFSPLPVLSSSDDDYQNALSGTNSGSIGGTGSAPSSYLDALKSQNSITPTGTGPDNYLNSVSKSDPIEFTPPQQLETYTEESINQSQTNTEMPTVSETNKEADKTETKEEDDENTFTVTGSYLEGVRTTSVCRLGISTGRSFSRTYVQNSLMSATRAKDDSGSTRNNDSKLFMSSSGWDSQDVKNNNKSSDEVELQVENIQKVSWDNNDVEKISTMSNVTPKSTPPRPVQMNIRSNEQQILNKNQRVELARNKIVVESENINKVVEAAGKMYAY